MKWVALAVVVLGAFALTACDGDDEPAATGTPPVTQAARTTAAPAPSRTAVAVAATPTATPPGAATQAPATPTPSCTGRCPSTAPLPAPTPARAVGADGVPVVPPLLALAFSPGGTLEQSDLYTRGAGPAARGALNVTRVIIPSIGVDAAVQGVTVASDGVMPRPPSLDVVVWYDFAAFQGLGGLPLEGGNAIFAGDAQRQDVGAGVFTALSLVAPGEIITLVMIDGRRLYYVVEFNRTIDAAQWSEAVVAATADESATFITGAGSIPPGGTMASARRVVWGRRVNCAPGGSTCELPR